MATKMYMCCSCDELHKRETDAEECCKPEVEEVYLCDACCPEIQPINLCPTCFREYSGVDINRAAIHVSGHCQTCNPHFSFDEQFAIEDLHYQRTGKHARLNA